MKTKILSIAVLTILMISTGMAQSVDYKAKEIQLIPEKSYLPYADWESLFYDPTKTTDVEKAGLDKQVAIGPDERVYISDRSNFTITILDKTGKLLKTFGKKGYVDGEFVNNQDLDGILSNKYLVVSDNQGRINIFDLEGNFVKLITIDFMPLRIFPLKTGNMIVWGHVPVSGAKSKKVIAELDFNTGEYKVFYEKTESHEREIITMPVENGLVSVGAPYSRGKNMISITNDDGVVIANNQTGEVTIFRQSNGKYEESGFKVQAERIEIGEQEKEEYYLNFKARLKSQSRDTIYAEKMKVEGFFPEHLPYFYNMILDEQNNALLFIYTNTEGQDYAFLAYSPDGKLLGQSEFKIDGYDLLANMGHFKFKDGFVYTLALKKGAEHPLRVLKCRME